MGNKGKKPWKLFGSLSHGGNVLPASATAEARRIPRSAPAIQQKPIEFVCPISGELMADPVILLDGQSYERSCILACIDLHLDHATLSANHLPSLSPTTQLIPNLGLRSAIIKWCESNGIQYPDPIPAGVARLLVRNLISSQFHPSPRVHPHFSAHVPEISTPFRSPHHQMPPEFTPLTGDDNVSSAADCGNISSQIIEEDGEEDRSVPQGIPMEFGYAVLEEQIVTKLGSTDIAEQEVALLLLRHVTREHPEQRTDLCSRRLLSSLCPYLLSPNQSLQSNALAALINLSIHQSNKIPIVQSHAVPSLITAVDSAHAGTRSDAVAAIFSLSVVAENKSIIGELGAIPPLFHLLSESDETIDTRRQAALALHHLISTCPTNLSTLINTPGSAKTLLDVVLMESTLLSYWKKSTQKPQPPPIPFKKDWNEALCGYVMMVIGTMAGTTEGSTALTNAGAVETMVDMMKTLQTANNSKTVIKDPTLTTRRNQCVGVLSRLSRGSLRFHPLATEAGAEQVLAQFCANDDDDDDDEGDNGTNGKYGSRNFKEKARMMLSDLRRDGSATTLTTGTNVSGIALPNRRAWGGGYLPRNIGAKSSES